MLILLSNIDLCCFVARQFLSQIYALLSVKFSDLKMCECKKNDKYEVCTPGVNVCKKKTQLIRLWWLSEICVHTPTVCWLKCKLFRQKQCMVNDWDEELNGQTNMMRQIWMWCFWKRNLTDLSHSHRQQNKFQAT